jgi:DNA polymerase-3 subunit alpha
MKSADKNTAKETGKQFVHLHLHTDYSLLKSAVQIKPLAKKLKELGMSACAITDLGNLYGAVKFNAVLRSEGIKPIIGYDAYVSALSFGDKSGQVAVGDLPFNRVVLLAKNYDGYLNLVMLASLAFTEGLTGEKPLIDLELLKRHSKGLICLSGGTDGPIAQRLENTGFEKAVETAREWSEIFEEGDFFIELQDHGIEREKKLLPQLVELAERINLPLVATNDVYYSSQDDAPAHEVLMSVGAQTTLEDSTRPRLGSHEYYLKSAEEMWSLFGAKYPEALENTVKIADSCNVDFPKDARHMPNFPVPEGFTENEYFEKISKDGLEERCQSQLNVLWGEGRLVHKREDYERRLNEEIAMIQGMGFPGYFLIVWDFIKYAREAGIPVGPGRGSAAGSLVAFCLGITDVDPMEFNLLFERFLNPERVSMPDIDIDFCIRGRGQVINYVTEKYGKESVCQIVTFGTLASRAAVRDVGRALNMPLPEVDRVARMIPPPVRGRNIPIAKAVEEVTELKAAMEKDPRVKNLISLAMKLEGCSRHTSVHAAGVVISPKPLQELVPIAISPKGETTTQYSMVDLEDVGMLKMDFLGLTTLTIIDDCLRSIEGDDPAMVPDLKMIKDQDEGVMELFGEGRTDAIFQFESTGMKAMCRNMRPTGLEDLAALNALYRPGPLDGGMIDDFIERHKGGTFKYLHPSMEEILKNTFGIFVYQEQIMQVAQKIGGYSLGEADMMRRAMGKKKREEMLYHEKRFTDGAVASEFKIDERKAKEIFDLMALFADYGFNRSHSVAYARVAYETAFLKAHFPAHFYSAVLSHESGDSAKLYRYSKEMQSAGIELLPPDINESNLGFTPVGGAVRFGLAGVKGIGEGSVSDIINARKEGGPFTSIFDLAKRVRNENRPLTKKVFEVLITAGALDSVAGIEASPESKRPRLIAAIPDALALAARSHDDEKRGQSNLFAAVEDDSAPQELPVAEPWTLIELGTGEKQVMGVYLTYHPLHPYKEHIELMNIRPIADQMAANERLEGEGTFIGIVSDFAVRMSRSGNRYASFVLEDQSRSMRCLLLGQPFEKLSSVFANDVVVLVSGKYNTEKGADGSEDSGEISLRVHNASRLEDEIAKRPATLSIDLPTKFGDLDYLRGLLEVLFSRRGNCDVLLNLVLDEGIVIKVRPPDLRVARSTELESELRRRGCEVNWNAGNK